LHSAASSRPSLGLRCPASPDAVKAAANLAATANVPYRWVVRRLFLGRFTDSDKV